MTDPAGWRSTTLAAVARLGSGGTPQARESEFYDGEIPWAVIGDLNDGIVTSTARRITAAGLEASSAKWVPTGAVLIAMYGSIGKLGIAGVPLTTNQAIAFAVPGPDVDTKFLFYYLLSQRRQLDAMGKGATQRNISQAILKPWPVALPDLDEQRRIVEILEDHLSRLDAGRSGLSDITQRAKCLWTSGLWAATHNLAGSRTVRLDEIASVRLGRQRSPKNHSGDRMRPYLRAANVDWNSLRLDDILEMNFTAAEESTYRLQAGDILLAEASGSPAEVGKSVLYTGAPKDVCFQNTLLRVRAHAADPEFLQKYLLAEAHAGRFMPETRGVGINHLGRARLAALRVELPASEKQAASVAECRRLAGRVEALNAAVEIAQRRASNLRRALLTAAFSGQLTGGRTDDEVIEELAEAMA